MADGRDAESGPETSDTDGPADGSRSIAVRGFSDPRESPWPYLLLAVAALAGVVVWLTSARLFPYHSVNHDEGVYLQQAAMLLEGRLWLTPPVPDAVRPWFFVREGGRLYPKYTPVTAAVFAPALAVGLPRLSLVVVGAGIVALVGLLGRAAFDWPTGVVAAALVLTAPLFVLSSSVFLSYAPATALNLLFALSYLRAHRRESRRYALLAGLAVGVAFFARPYTAVLFALPFVGHALFTLGREWRRTPGRAADRVRALPTRRPVVRTLVVGVLGVAFVALAFGYNWTVTGDPLTFPYQAFAPEDGPGFGHREILAHERDYTPALALEANRRVVALLLGQWGPLGWLGSALAALGLAVGLAWPATRRYRPQGEAGGEERASSAGGATDEGREGPSDLLVRGLLAALLGTVVVGNVYFWGNLNVLGDLDEPGDGLVAVLGPFYHFDLLLPLAVFAAAGVVAIGRRVRRLAGGLDSQVAYGIVLAVALAGGLVVGGAVGAQAFDEPVERNEAHRDAVASAYEPFADREFDDALVFVPTPYGDWLQHPFQWLRNDPSLDGEAVYVLDRGPDGDFESLDAFPDRRPYRFTYQGEWPPEAGVDAVVEPLTVERGDRLHVRTTTGVVPGAEAATVRIAAGGEAVQYGLGAIDGSRETVTWTVGPDRARVVGDGVRRYSENASVPLKGETTLVLSVTYTQPGGSTVTYRQELDVDAADGEVRALWPPETRVCRLTPDCGYEGMYVEGGDYPTGASLSTNVTAVSGSG